MSQVRVHLRTRGGPSQGWGNVWRLAAFADACRARRGAECVFFAEGPPSVAAFLRERDFQVVELPDGISLADEEAVLRGHQRADVSVLELLDVTLELQRLHRAHSDRVVVFDDLCDHTYDADIVVCGQDLPSHANRLLSAPETKFLVGYDYFPMRPEFLGVSACCWERVERVLVTLGGGRYDVGYRKAALALAALPEIPATTFVLGNESSAELRAQIEATLPGANVLATVTDLPDLLASHDLALTGGGYTKLEAAVVGVPQLVMSVQWHQVPLAETFAARTGVPHLGYMAYVTPGQITAQVQALAPRATRENLVEAARLAVDGRGLERVLTAVLGGPTEEESCSGAAA